MRVSRHGAPIAITATADAARMISAVGHSLDKEANPVQSGASGARGELRVINSEERVCYSFSGRVRSPNNSFGPCA
jgi:hypothetical protein